MKVGRTQGELSLEGETETQQKGVLSWKENKRKYGCSAPTVEVCVKAVWIWQQE